MLTLLYQKPIMIEILISFRTLLHYKQKRKRVYLKKECFRNEAVDSTLDSSPNVDWISAISNSYYFLVHTITKLMHVSTSRSTSFISAKNI